MVLGHPGGLASRIHGPVKKANLNINSHQIDNHETYIRTNELLTTREEEEKGEIKQNGKTTIL